MYNTASTGPSGPAPPPPLVLPPSHVSAATRPPPPPSAPAAGSSTSVDPFAQHADLCRSLSSLYVANLKTILKRMRELREACGLSLQGNKADLVARIQMTFGDLKKANNVAAYLKVKAWIFAEFPARLLARFDPAAAAARYQPPPASESSYGGQSGQSSRPGWQQGLPPRPPTAAAAASRPMGAVQFRPSPFYKVVSLAGQPVNCEPAGYTERRTKSVFFSLTTEQKVLLQANPSPHEVRLFCIPGSQYDNSLRTGTQVHVEFPQTCEVRVNGTPLSANLRGTKKSVCRSPPNLNKDKGLAVDTANRVEIIYSNCPQRYTVVAAVCLVTSAATLAARLRAANLMSKEAVLSKMLKAAADDDDVVSGEGTLSLKCPLSYMRIETPCRSHMCTHQQCFDANSFFSMNEQTPNWICPVCSKKLVPEHLIVDGYFDDILKRVPKSFDSVISEPSGDWHTSDGQYTLSGVPHQVAKIETSALLDDSDEDEKDPNLFASSHLQTNGAGSSLPYDARTPLAHERNGSAAVDITIDTPSPNRTAGNGNSATTRPREIIDLTLDSDDEAPPPPKRQRLESANQ